jgi:3-oxoacyl-[acyl-carrier protein] reductase
MDLHLKDKVIMAAASSKGLGFGIANALAREGAKVSMASRTLNDINTAAEQIEASHSTMANAYQFDASDSDSINKWVSDTLNDFGTIDGLLVNAGGPPTGKFNDFDDAAWLAAYELTLMSSVRMIRAVLPTMRAQGSGAILTVTSTSIKEPIDVLLLSNVFRSGVVSLVKSLSKELAGEGIRINNLVPGRIDTDRIHAINTTAAKQAGISVEQQRENQQKLIPMGRYGTTEEFGDAGAFLLSDASSYITGATLMVDGGITHTVW